MTPLELSEIQAYLFTDYKEMGSSKYYLLQVKDAEVAKKFLTAIAENITREHAFFFPRIQGRYGNRSSSAVVRRL
jgi:hypothetical protein